MTKWTMSTLSISGKAVANGRGSGIGVQNSSMSLMRSVHPRLVAVSSKRCSLGCDTSEDSINNSGCQLTFQKLILVFLVLMSNSLNNTSENILRQSCAL